MSSTGGTSGPECGSATAETAMVLPVLLIVLGMAVWVLACVSGQLRCVDAAAIAARSAARGDSPAVVAQAARRVAPAGASVQVRVVRDDVEVVVRARLRPPTGALSRLPGVQVSGRAVAADEDRVAGR